MIIETDTAVNDKPEWTVPTLEDLGGMDDVAGGGNPGLDANALPAAVS